MNKFEKKALAKRAYKALVKMAEWYHTPSWRRIDDEFEARKYPEKLSYEEIMDNGAENKYDFDHHPRNDKAPLGIRPWVAQNTEVKYIGDTPYSTLGPGYRLPENYKRPYGPLMDATMGRDLISRKEIPLLRFDPDSTYRDTPTETDLMPGGAYWEAMRAYYPRMAYEMDKANARQSLPDSIDLEPGPVPTSSGYDPPLWGRYPRSQKVHAKQEAAKISKPGAISGSTLSNRAGRAPGY